MRTLIVGGQPGVQAYENAKRRLEKAGCEVLREIPARQASRSWDLPTDCELVLVLTTWAGHSAIDQVRATLKGMDDPPAHVFSPHQWSKLKPHLDRVGVMPRPASPAPAPAPPEATVERRAPPPPTPDPEPAVKAVEELPVNGKPNSTQQPERPASERLREAVFNLVAEMRSQNIAKMTLDRDGKVSLERVVVSNETFDLEL